MNFFRLSDRSIVNTKTQVMLYKYILFRISDVREPVPLEQIFISVNIILLNFILLNVVRKKFEIFWEIDLCIKLFYRTSIVSQMIYGVLLITLYIL